MALLWPASVLACYMRAKSRPSKTAQRATPRTNRGLCVAARVPTAGPQIPRLIIHNSTQIGGFQFTLGVLVQIGGSTSYASFVCCPRLSTRARLCSPSCARSPGGLVPLAPAVLCASSPLCVSTHRSGRRSRPCAARGTPRSRTCSPRAADATGCASPPPRRSAPPQSPPRAPSGRWRS